MPTPAGTIGILTTEHGRYSRFWNSFLAIQPPGPTKIITKYSLNIAEARNQCLEEAEGDWVWFMDDDHVFAPDLLRNLLARNVDVIQPLVLSRYAPFGPVIMGPKAPNGKAHWRFALNQNDPLDLKEVFVAGAAGMLIRRHVWEKIDPPWFTMGQIDPAVLSEDMSFCHKVTAAGFHIWCDMQNIMEHLNVGSVAPRRKPDGSWVTVIRFGNSEVEIPVAEAKFRVDANGNALDMQGNPVDSNRTDFYK
jgi:glycosyltransferase involved in cell wall biosynthesis